jgi:hypothetical protein
LKENEIDFGEIDNIYESNILVANKIYNIQIVWFHEEEKIRVQVGNLRFEFSIFFSTLFKSNLFK